MGIRERHLLRYLVNRYVYGTWCTVLPKGIGPVTTDRSHENGHIRWKRVHIRNKDGVQSFRMAIQITAKGRRAFFASAH